jgi:SAM-dependent methyltransferase
MASPSIVRAIKRHGIGGTIRLAIQKIGSSQAPGGRSQFDLDHGVDTDGDDDLRDLNIDAPADHVLYGNRYQATSPEMFAKMMSVAPITPNMLFIDIGSGKGRALLMASAYPFKRIIGVEFAAELAATAQDNIRKFGAPKEIESVCANALTWEFPPEPSLIYIYNSFGKPLMRSFIKRLEQSVQDHPRQLIVIYRNPTCRELWSNWPQLHADQQFMVLRPPL